MEEYFGGSFAMITDTGQIQGSSGGVVNFYLNAGAARGLRNYFLLGSLSGTAPGLPLPGGSVTLPLNWDLFMSLVYWPWNTPVFTDFTGTLDASGTAAARLDTLNPLPPGSSGAVMHFAYALGSPYNFVSNPVGVEITP